MAEPGHNAERNQQIIALRLKGWSNTQIGMEVGCSRNVVAGVCDRAGIKVRPVRETIKAHETPQKPSWAGGKSFKRGGCRWIDGDPLTPDWQYCNHPVCFSGSSWCGEHKIRATLRRPTGEAA